MGIGDMLGIRMEKVVCKNKYTMEELYEKIKDVTFEAGQPMLAKTIGSPIIVFPKVDRNNQVQILPSGGGTKFTVQRSAQPAGLDNMIMNDVLNSVTDGWSSMSGAFGDTKKRCLALTTSTAEVLRSLDL